MPACERYAWLDAVDSAGGWLTGKYRRDTRPSGASRLGDNPARGMEAYDRRNTDATWAVLDALEDVAKQSGLTMQAALAWLADRPQVTSPTSAPHRWSRAVAGLAGRR